MYSDLRVSTDRERAMGTPAYHSTPWEWRSGADDPIDRRVSDSMYLIGGTGSSALGPIYQASLITLQGVLLLY